MAVNNFSCPMCEIKTKTEPQLNSHLLFTHYKLKSECSTGLHLTRYQESRNIVEKINYIVRQLQRRIYARDNQLQVGVVTLSLILAYIECKQRLRELGYDNIKTKKLPHNDEYTMSSYEVGTMFDFLNGYIERPLI